MKAKSPSSYPTITSTEASSESSPSQTRSLGSVRSRLQSEKGLTLVELTMVVILIGVMSAVLASGIFSQGEGAKARLNESKMQKLKSSLASYRLQYNKYPNKLQNLVTGGGEKGALFTPFATEDDINDIWGFPYIYKSENSGRSFSLLSYGSDGVSGGEGADSDVTVSP